MRQSGGARSNPERLDNELSQPRGACTGLGRPEQLRNLRHTVVRRGVDPSRDLESQLRPPLAEAVDAKFPGGVPEAGAEVALLLSRQLGANLPLDLRLPAAELTHGLSDSARKLGDLRGPEKQEECDNDEDDNPLDSNRKLGLESEEIGDGHWSLRCADAGGLLWAFPFGCVF